MTSPPTELRLKSPGRHLFSRILCEQQKGERLSRPAQLIASLSYRKTPNLSNVGRGRHVTTAAGPVDVDVLVHGEVLAGVLGLDTEGVRTEVVTLGL